MMYNYDRGPLPYTDLAVERGRADLNAEGVEYERVSSGEFCWERLRITSAAGERSFGRPRGSYHTLNTERMDMLDGQSVSDAADEISRELRRMISALGIKRERILVVGLGNRSLTSDSLGCLTCDRIKPTRHIKEYDEGLFYTLNCSEISVITPGVKAKTGLDSTDVVAAICKQIHPDLVIVIDAIATSSYERLGSTVQITDTGICPGSGLFNHDKAIDRTTLGTPVISVGVPTVIDARMLYLDGVGNGNIQNPDRIPSPSMLVSPKEIDEIVNYSSQIIANAINKGFGIYQ